MSRYSYESQSNWDSGTYRTESTIENAGHRGPFSLYTSEASNRNRNPHRSRGPTSLDFSEYSGFTDMSGYSDLSFKNMSAMDETVMIPVGHIPGITDKRDLQIEQPGMAVPRPLPPKKRTIKLDDYWQPDLTIIGAEAEPVVVEGFKKFAAKAVVKYRKEDDICGKIKSEMDREFGRAWCCIYGVHFDSFVTHDGGMFIYFKLENKFGLLWRNRYK